MDFPKDRQYLKWGLWSDPTVFGLRHNLDPNCQQQQPILGWRLLLLFPDSRPNQFRSWRVEHHYLDIRHEQGAAQICGGNVLQF